jgi:AcrR family transcriptional regulator
MTLMSTGYENTGRTRQKARTREALVAAARELLTEDSMPTVEQAADRAGVSRTTAYRYFGDRRQLLAATYPEIDAVSLLDPDAPDDPVERFEIVLERLGRQIIDHEPELRAQLRLSLDTRGPHDLALRQGRALRWIEDALAPLRRELGKRQVQRLSLAIRASFGIEPLVWLTDVAGLSSVEALDVMRTTARTLLEAAVAHARS